MNPDIHLFSPPVNYSSLKKKQDRKKLWECFLIFGIRIVFLIDRNNLDGLKIMGFKSSNWEDRGQAVFCKYHVVGFPLMVFPSPLEGTQALS